MSYFLNLVSTVAVPNRYAYTGVTDVGPCDGEHRVGEVEIVTVEQIFQFECTGHTAARQMSPMEACFEPNEGF